MQHMVKLWNLLPQEAVDIRNIHEVKKQQGGLREDWFIRSMGGRYCCHAAGLWSGPRASASLCLWKGHSSAAGQCTH